LFTKPGVRLIKDGLVRYEKLVKTKNVETYTESKNFLYKTFYNEELYEAHKSLIKTYATSTSKIQCEWNEVSKTEVEDILKNLPDSKSDEILRNDNATNESPENSSPIAMEAPFSESDNLNQKTSPENTSSIAREAPFPQSNNVYQKVSLSPGAIQTFAVDVVLIALKKKVEELESKLEALSKIVYHEDPLQSQEPGVSSSQAQHPDKPKLVVSTNANMSSKVEIPSNGQTYTSQEIFKPQTKPKPKLDNKSPADKPTTAPQAAGYDDEKNHSPELQATENMPPRDLASINMSPTNLTKNAPESQEKKQSPLNLDKVAIENLLKFNGKWEITRAANLEFKVRFIPTPRYAYVKIDPLIKLEAFIQTINDQLSPPEKLKIKPQLVHEPVYWLIECKSKEQVNQCERLMSELKMNAPAPQASKLEQQCIVS
jgi:hypothetical protein